MRATEIRATAVEMTEHSAEAVSADA
jgi:hypothetical protein